MTPVSMQAAEPPANRITPTEAASRLVAEEAGLQTVEQVLVHLLDCLLLLWACPGGKASWATCADQVIENPGLFAQGVRQDGVLIVRAPKLACQCGISVLPAELVTEGCDHMLTDLPNCAQDPRWWGEGS